MTDAQLSALFDRTKQTILDAAKEGDASRYLARDSADAVVACLLDAIASAYADLNDFDARDTINQAFDRLGE